MTSVNQPLLISVLNAQTDTIDAHKKLIGYMNKHITELEQLFAITKKELDNAKSTITALNETIDDLKRDNITIRETVEKLEEKTLEEDNEQANFL
jgi:hypothetical protein